MTLPQYIVAENGVLGEVVPSLFWDSRLKDFSYGNFTAVPDYTGNTEENEARALVSRYFPFPKGDAVELYLGIFKRSE